MRKLIYIVFILLLTHSLLVSGQKSQSLMAGTKGAKYWVSGTPGMSFTWALSGGGTIVRGMFSDSVFVDWDSIPGTYKLSVDGLTPYGCKSLSRTVFVTVDTFINPDHIKPHLDTAVYICSGDSFTFNGGSGYSSYRWENGDTGQFHKVKNTGNISLSVTDITGYEMFASSKLVLRPLPVFDLGRDTVLCGVQSFTLDAGSFVPKFIWSTGDSSQFLTITTNKELFEKYKVTKRDSFGCKSSDSINLHFSPLPKINLGPDTILCGRQSYILDAGNFASIFNWSTGENTQVISVKPPSELKEEFWVVAQDINGCVSTDTVKLFSCNTNLYSKKVPTAFTPNGDGQNDYWLLPEIEQYKNCTIEVYDRWGRIVFKANKGYNKPWDGLDLKGNELPLDSYFFIIDLKVGGKDPIYGNITILR